MSIFEAKEWLPVVIDCYPLVAMPSAGSYVFHWWSQQNGKCKAIVSSQRDAFTQFLAPH